MVFIHLKQSDKNQFIFETTTKSTNDALIRKLAKIFNMRIMLGRLCEACGQLAQYGPEKLEGDKGLDSIQDEEIDNAMKGGYETNAKSERGINYREDPTGNRTGNAPMDQLGQVILKTCAEAQDLLQRTGKGTRKVYLTEEMLQECIDNIRGSVMIAFPMGLPPHDTVRLILEDTMVEDRAISQEMVDPDTCKLWWAGKEFIRSQTVADRCGRNEKTTVKCKLGKKGTGAPAREPVVSEKERKAMMAHYFKKQEEMKKLALNEDDEYSASSWANPKALKSSLSGMGSIKAPGI